MCSLCKAMVMNKKPESTKNRATPVCPSVTKPNAAA